MDFVRDGERVFDGFVHEDDLVAHLFGGQIAKLFIEGLISRATLEALLLDIEATKVTLGGIEEFLKVGRSATAAIALELLGDGTDALLGLEVIEFYIKKAIEKLSAATNRVFKACDLASVFFSVFSTGASPPHESAKSFQAVVSSSQLDLQLV